MVSRWLLSAFLMFYSGIGLSDSEDCNNDESNFRCVEYVTNYDGDTITFNIPGVHPLIGKRVNIRLRGVDTPEMRSDDPCEKKLAVKARTFLAYKLQTATRIDLLNIERGKYFRIVANVKAGGRYMERALIRNSLGVPYIGGGTKPVVDWCELLAQTE